MPPPHSPAKDGGDEPAASALSTELPTPRRHPASFAAPPRPHVGAEMGGTPNPGRRRGYTLGLQIPPANVHHAATPASADTVVSNSGVRPRSARTPEHHKQVADILDVVDPEHSTVTTLTDLQHSLFIPDLGAIFEDVPALRFSRQAARNTPSEPPSVQGSSRSQSPRAMPIAGSLLEMTTAQGTGRERPLGGAIEEGLVPAASPATSSMTAVGDAPELDDTDAAIKGEFLLLPRELISNWDEWTEEEKQQLDDYVRHLRFSRKERLRRTWRGFCHYVRTPMGAFIVIYASLLTFWGAAWMLFLIGWIGAGNKQAYFVEICDQILTALFCVVGIGLFPFRLYDTYHMTFIVHYHRKILRLRRERGYDPMPDPNEIPVEAPEAVGTIKRSDVPTEGNDAPFNIQSAPAKCAATIEDLEAAHQLHHGVLTDSEYASFLYHQRKFGKSHTFYRPHESVTHRAFPLDLMIVVILMLDFHSIFQLALGSLTWSVSYHHHWKRKATAVILSVSISINIAAGLVIAVGNSRTRKKEVIERLFRQAITEEALRRAGRRPDKHHLPTITLSDAKATRLPESPRRASAHKKLSKSSSTLTLAAEPEAPGLSTLKDGNAGNGQSRTSRALY